MTGAAPAHTAADAQPPPPVSYTRTLFCARAVLFPFLSDRVSFLLSSLFISLLFFAFFTIYPLLFVYSSSPRLLLFFSPSIVFSLLTQTPLNNTRTPSSNTSGTHSASRYFAGLLGAAKRTAWITAGAPPRHCHAQLSGFNQTEETGLSIWGSACGSFCVCWCVAVWVAGEGGGGVLHPHTSTKTRGGTADQPGSDKRCVFADAGVAVKGAMANIGATAATVVLLLRFGEITTTLYPHTYLKTRGRKVD